MKRQHYRKRFSRPQMELMLSVFMCNAGKLPKGESTTKVGRWLYYGTRPNDRYPNSSHGHTIYTEHWHWREALLVCGIIMRLLASRRMASHQAAALRGRVDWLVTRFHLSAVDQLVITHTFMEREREPRKEWVMPW